MMFLAFHSGFAVFVLFRLGDPQPPLSESECREMVHLPHQHLGKQQQRFQKSQLPKPLEKPLKKNISAGIFDTFLLSVSQVKITVA